MENKSKLTTDTQLRTTFGIRLRRLREDKRMTLDELCNDINSKLYMDMKISGLSNYENKGYRIPTLFTIAKLAEYYDVSTDYLMGKTDDKNVKLVQTTMFDEYNIKHTIKIGIDKNDSLNDMKFGDVRKLLEGAGYKLNINSTK